MYLSSATSAAYMLRTAAREVCMQCHHGQAAASLLGVLAAKVAEGDVGAQLLALVGLLCLADPVAVLQRVCMSPSVLCTCLHTS